MRVLWQLRIASTRDVWERVVDQHPVTYMTIKTTLDRLAEKGFVSKDTSETAFRYRALMSKSDYGQRIVGELLTWMAERFPDELDAVLSSRLASLAEAPVGPPRGEAS